MTDRRPHRRGGSAACPDGGSRDAAPSNQSRRFPIEDIWRGRRTALRLGRAGPGWGGVLGWEEGQRRQSWGKASRKVGSSCCRSAVIRARSTLTPRVNSLISLNGGGGGGGGAVWRWQPRAGSLSGQKLALCLRPKKKRKEKKGGILTSCVLGSNYY